MEIKQEFFQIFPIMFSQNVFIPYLSWNIYNPFRQQSLSAPSYYLNQHWRSREYLGLIIANWTYRENLLGIWIYLNKIHLNVTFNFLLI